MQNLFYSGDNLDGLRLLADMAVAVDLVYIDPPFATNNEFLIDDDRANTISASGRLAYWDTVKGSAYLRNLEDRLRGIKDVMSPAGTIYVHIDDKMQHHVRLLLDAVFGAENFRNSITRVKCNPKNFDRYGYGNFKDTILFYSKSPGPITWNPQREPLTDDEVVRLYPFIDEKGRRYTTNPLHAPGVTENGSTGQQWRGMLPPTGRHWRYPPEKLDELEAAGLIAWSTKGNPRKIRYAEDSKGKLPQDVWLYKDPQQPRYPTQKNARMLERIIRTSSNPGDIVMDCYAGSGSTLLTAARTDRFFVGMENSPAALSAIEKQFLQRNIGWKEIKTRKEVGMTQNQTQSVVDFNELEHQISLANLDDMLDEIVQRSERLQTRVAHFADRSGIPEEDFWNGLQSDPSGPLAAVLALEARRQNTFKKAVAECVHKLDHVDTFRKLPSSGPSAHYVDERGRIITGRQLPDRRRPSKPLDFHWETGGITCYAAQRYIREEGGHQNTQFKEILSLLENFQHGSNDGIALFILVDGEYFDQSRLVQLRELAVHRNSVVYVTSVNALQPILEDMVGAKSI